jgi:glyoxylase I family protein
MAFEIRGVTTLLQVYDMPTSIRFYRDKLGFEVVTTSPVLGVDKFHWAMLRLEDAQLMLNTAYESDDERPAVPDAARVANHEDVCLYFDCPDVDKAYAELSAKGIAVKKPTIAPYGMKQLYLRDPDGYGLCFQWPVQKR